MNLSSLPAFPWLEVVNPSFHPGRIRHVLFDFDGTLSVIRHGWEKVMFALMAEMICDGHPLAPELAAEIAAYIDRSTGILTIKQMKWLEEAVNRHGLSKTRRTAAEYKKIYNERLLVPVCQRLSTLDQTQDSRDTLMIAGSRNFLQKLSEREVNLFLASGTDQVYVQKEADALGISHYFNGHIYGAVGDSEDDSKELVIRRILSNHRLQGVELLVVGDGPVEIQYARSAGAMTLGVAADEEKHYGLNVQKRKRLLSVGVDLIVTDFLHADELVNIFTGSRSD